MEKENKQMTAAEDRHKRRRRKRMIQSASEGLCLGLVFFLAILALSCQKKHESNDPINAQLARLIDKKESIGLHEYNAVLFYDRDGQTNTAESVCFVSTHKLSDMEALRHVRVNQIQTVGQWKSNFKAISPQLIWEDLLQRSLK